jgi:hypothetical protein
MLYGPDYHENVVFSGLYRGVVCRTLIFHTELIGFGTLSIVRVLNNLKIKTRRFANWICFKGRTSENRASASAVCGVKSWLSSLNTNRNKWTSVTSYRSSLWNVDLIADDGDPDGRNVQIELANMVDRASHMGRFFVFPILAVASRRMRWAGHVARMGETRNAYRILVWKAEGKRPRKTKT